MSKIKRNPNGSPVLEPWIETYTGIKFHFLDPRREEIAIEDIAHSLAHQCRFSGHTRVFYSVAQHSIEVAKLSGEALLTGLLHDASEAYIHDIPSPVKPHLKNYREIEDRIMAAIANKFNLIWPLPQIVKDADAICLKAEARGLLPSKGGEWVAKYPTPFDIPRVRPSNALSPAASKAAFMELFDKIQSMRKEVECTSPTTKLTSTEADMLVT